VKYVALLLLAATASLAQPVDLTGPWKLSPTDDPRWADPGIDDSSWPVVTLPQRLRGQFGIFWLRRTVPGPPQSADLAIAIGLQETYEVYVNGSKVGGRGDMGTLNPRFVRPQWFRVPPGLIREGAPIVVALRISVVPGSWGAITGGVRDEGPYLITSAPHADAEVRAANLSMRQKVAPGMLMAFGQLGIGLFLLVLWFAERQRREHLYFAGFLILSSIIFLMAIWVVYTSQPYAWMHYVYTPVSVVLLLCLAQFATHVLEVRPIRGYVLAGAAMLGVGAALFSTRYNLYPPMALIAWQCLRALGNTAAKGTRGITFAILAYLVALFNNSIPVNWRFMDGHFELGGMSAALTNLLQLLFATAMMILLLRRLAADRQEKQRLAAELEAARVVQQLLLSQASVDGGVYEIETVYEPAQHVGGDFFWVRTDADGALLVMVGDVSGKGMKAAMLVTLIMGVLRQRAERQPEELLTLVNRALAGEMHGGFVTACCMRADPDGTVTIANAGHLLPCRQGQEIDVPSGLPLGVAADVEYDSGSLSLAPGEQLTFVSDGVVEAASRTGELLGFDRTRALSAKPAHEIAEAAKAWGQNDDITVVTVRRAG
jgi:hypothetical protein